MAYRCSSILWFSCLLLTTRSTPAQPQSTPSCKPTQHGESVAAVLGRSQETSGLLQQAGLGLSIHASMIRVLRDLSDRSYPPYSSSVGAEEIWYEGKTGMEEYSGGGPTLALDANSVYQRTDSLRPATGRALAFGEWERAFNPWAVVHDWSLDPSVRLVGRCRFRDAWRLVLARGPGAAELLYLSASDGIPVALQRQEFSYFKGAEPVTYLYSAWDRTNGVAYPQSIVRSIAGVTDRERTLSQPNGLEVASHVFAVLQPVGNRNPLPGRIVPPPVWSDEVPDTVRIAPSAFLLVNRWFTSAVALVADTVFIFDAPQGEARAMEDAAWIGRLFPGRHPFVFVAQTVIWPHVAGLRYWASRGATIVTDAAGAGFVRQALATRWTGHPDRWERRRGGVTPVVQVVNGRSSRARGGLILAPVEGTASEGVLLGYVTTAHFLWASDRLQDTTTAGLYTEELVGTVRTLKLEPEWTSGPHFQRVSWRALEKLYPE